MADRGGGHVVVEGYVDVIAMTRAGASADGRTAGNRATQRTARPALAGSRCADAVLRWRQGRRRAAYRAIDLALPLLTPGKSVSFALLPEGRTPTTF